MAAWTRHRLYCIRINGHLGATLLSAFPAMVSEQQAAVTVLTGLLDRSALYGVLAEIETLGLDLIEVRQIEVHQLTFETNPAGKVVMPVASRGTQRYAPGTATVSRIGFGAMQLPGPGVFGPPRDRDAAIAVLRRAAELGIDHIDTAQYYGPDVANELIRAALYPYPEGLALVSKVGARRDTRRAECCSTTGRPSSGRESRTTCGVWESTISLP
jgi:hypothetical protein